jgi:hypothetical protein
MRVNPGYAPPPVQPPPPKELPTRPGPDAVQPKPKKGWSLLPEKDPIDYDDGAWM